MQSGGHWEAVGTCNCSCSHLRGVWCSSGVKTYPKEPFWVAVPALKRAGRVRRQLSLLPEDQVNPSHTAGLASALRLRGWQGKG